MKIQLNPTQVGSESDGHWLKQITNMKVCGDNFSIALRDTHTWLRGAAESLKVVMA